MKSMSWNYGYPVLFSADKIKSFVILFCESKSEVHVLKVTVRDLENENAKTEALFDTAYFKKMNILFE